MTPPTCSRLDHDGRQVAAARLGGKLFLWNVDSDSISELPLAQGTYVLALEFSGNGQRLAVGGNNGIVSVWDTRSNELVWVIAPAWIIPFKHWFSAPITSVSLPPTEIRFMSGTCPRKALL